MSETIDELRAFALRIIQPRDGYRFSLDPLLLCKFSEFGTGTRVIDLGTGSGVIPLVLARKAADVTIVGVEFQQTMAEIAARNVLLNGMEGRVEIVCTDILELRKRFPVSTFDMVISNPPYRTRGSGRVSPRAGRDLARHESSAGLFDFLATAKYLVKPSGNIYFICHPSRLSEFIQRAGELNLAILRLRMVHGSPTAPASIFMAELAKGKNRDIAVLPPFFVNDDLGGYSDEMRRILGE